jgi:hypothetical protein
MSEQWLQMHEFSARLPSQKEPLLPNPTSIDLHGLKAYRGRMLTVPARLTDQNAYRTHPLMTSHVASSTGGIEALQRSVPVTRSNSDNRTTQKPP